ncbi:MAG: TSUP family transporter [Pseudomonadota bacterium]|nr:TSUP family transporter [Pseudomonadota bacterium]
MFEWLITIPVPFENVSLWAIVVVALAHGFGCFVRGAFGFGSNMPIVAATTFILGPHHAILLALMTSMVAQAHLLPQGYRTADWQIAKQLIVGLIFGTGFGVWLFAILSAEKLVLILGILISIIILMDTFKVVEHVSRFIEFRLRWMTIGFSFIGGTIGGISGAGAFYFLVVYLKHACQFPDVLRGTTVMLSTITMIMRFAILSISGFISLTVILEGLLLAPMVLLATWLGSQTFRNSSAEKFYQGLQVLLLSGGAALIYKGIQDFGLVR